jgi:hypothetical protein
MANDEAGLRLGPAACGGTGFVGLHARDRAYPLTDKLLFWKQVKT